MAELTLALKITGDGGSLRSDLQLDEAALRKLGVTAGQVEGEARRAAAGMGAVETATRQAAAAAQAYGAQTRVQAEAINSYGDRLDAMRAKFNPFVAAQREYLASRAEITEAVRLGGITEMEGARALDLSRNGYARQLASLRAASAATREHTGSLKLQSWQVTNLSQQLQDVAVQLGSGQNPFTIMLQQGPQITSAMGGVGNSLEIVKGLLTPTRLAIGGVTAALLTGAMAWNSYLNSVKAVEAASSGRGRSLGISPGDLEGIATAGADAANISRRTAREAEVAFLNTGRIGKETMEGLIAISRDYAATMNMDVGAAIEDLAQKFADPAKGAQELSRQLDLLDANTADYVRTLVSQNRIAEAQQVLLAALPARISEASRNVTMLSRAWYAVRTSASDAWDWMGRAIDRAVNGPEVSQDNLTRMQQRAAEIRSMLAQSSGFTDMTLGPATDQMRGELAFLDTWIASAQTKLAKAKADAANDNIKRTSAEGGAIAFGLTPGARDLDLLTQQQSKLKAILNDPATYAGKNNLGQVADAYDRVTHAIDTYITPAERARQQDELAVKALTARTPAERAAVAAQQKRLELAGQQVTAAEAEAQIASSGTVARAQATQSIADQNNALSLNARSTLDVADAYLQSADAAMVAEARRQALSEAVETGANVELRTRLLLQEAVSARAEEGARSVSDINAQTDAVRRLNDAVASGSMSVAEANAQSQIDAVLRPLLAAQAVAEGAAKEKLTRIIEQLRGAQARLNGEQSRGAALNMKAEQEDQLAALRLETSLVGANATARAVLIARLAAEQQMHRDNIEATSAEGQEILRNAEALAREGLAADRARDAWQNMGNIAESALSQVGDMLASSELSWSDWGDAAKSALQDVYKELWRLIVTAPLMNSLFGTNYSTISDAGGLIGSIFGGAFADGGAADPNKVILVGENGPELINTGSKGVFVTPLGNPTAKNTVAYAAANGGGSGQPVVNFTVVEGAGTKAEVKQSTDAAGNLSFELIVQQIDDAIGGNIANGKGSTFNAMRKRFGLNPSAGLRRSGS